MSDDTDFFINDSTLADNLLPNEAGSAAFDSYDEDERIDENMKAALDEKHMIRSSKGPLLDNVLGWFDTKIEELDKNSTVRQIMHGHETFKTNPDHGLDVASLAAEVSRRLLEEKRNELLTLKEIHAPDPER